MFKYPISLNLENIYFIKGHYKKKHDHENFHRKTVI